ncbi:MAG: hypothetical protein U9P63_03500 [Patescibacteria group bacterium]|nr:hypothetical protein [Patescibacteria group bacterium]
MLTKLIEFQEKINDYFLSSNWEETLFILKTISIILSILLIFVILFLIFQLRKEIKKSLELVTESAVSAALSKKTTSKEWESVLEKIEKEDTDSCKMAVIEADKILDDLLKRNGYAGEDMGERLKQITSAQLFNLDEVWQAHRVRNRIVHESDFKLTHPQAKRAVEIYQKALEDLEGI